MEAEKGKGGGKFCSAINCLNCDRKTYAISVALVFVHVNALSCQLLVNKHILKKKKGKLCCPVLPTFQKDACNTH